MLLNVHDLQMHYKSHMGPIQAVDGVSFSLKQNQTLGFVGESGCGKSSIAISILRLLPENGHIIGGNIEFNGRNLIALEDDKMRLIRWKQISMIFQSAMNALNPVFRVGDQLTEALLAHENITEQKAKLRAEGLFEMVGIPPERLASYPHEMSGGMRQRAIIAMSLMCNPKLVIADEPTTALDVVMQDQILKEIKKLQKKLGLGLILISHDIYVISEICDIVAVMYGGKIVEQGPVESVFGNPRHPYSAALLLSCPSIQGPIRDLVSLPGAPPKLLNPSQGCRFTPRCPYAQKICNSPDTPSINVSEGHSVLCHFAGNLEFEESHFPTVNFHIGQMEREKTVVKIHKLRKLFPVRRGLISSILGRSKNFVHAVDGVDFEIREGEILGLVGESGCGKTTTGMVMSLLESASSGKMSFNGTDATYLRGKRLKTFRRQVQPIFQDPYESINPRSRVFDNIVEPIIIHGIHHSNLERKRNVFNMLDLVGLKPVEDFVNKFPHQLSGGQRQRVAIARSMVLEPKLVIADEPVSMLDASVRSGIMRLMLDLRNELGVSFLFISHDLAAARYMCNRIAIMYLGRIVEIGPTEMLMTKSRHPYTKILLSAVPIGFQEKRTSQSIISDEPPNPINIPTGCRFHPRCPNIANICKKKEPTKNDIGPEHSIWCHNPSKGT